jgi:hypothetical protein
MTENIRPYRAQRPVPAGKGVITPAEARELRRLYAELPNAAAAAREALKPGSGPLTGDALQRFREIDARVVEIIDRIKAILS